MADPVGDQGVEAALDALVDRLQRLDPAAVERAGSAPVRVDREGGPLHDTEPSSPLRRLWGVMASDEEYGDDAEALLARAEERATRAEEDRARLGREVVELLARLQVAEGRSAALEAAPQVAPDADERDRLAARITELERELATSRDAEGAASSDLDDRLASMQAVVEAMRSGREDAERRLAELENALVAELRTAEIVTRDRDTLERERDALADQLRRDRQRTAPRLAELEDLRGRHGDALVEINRLAGELTELRAVAEATRAHLVASDEARNAAEAFANDTSRELGEAMGDLLGAREQIDALTAALDEEQRARGGLENELAEARARHAEELDAAAADAAEQDRQWATRLNDQAAELGAELEAAAQRIAAAEATVQERDDQLLHLRSEIEGLRQDLAARENEVDVLRTRLTEEIAIREEVVRDRDLVQAEVEYLRKEVLSVDAAKGQGKRGGLFSRAAPAPRRPGTPPGAGRPSERTGAEPSAPVVTSPEDLEAALDRRLFGE